MNELRKAAEQAAKELKELIHWHGLRYSNDKLVPAHRQTPEIKSAMKTLKELRQALAQPEHEPVAWLEPEWGEKICPEVGYEVTITDDHPKDLCWIPLYAHPPQPKREWVGLTDGERFSKDWQETVARAEAKLKEKNT